MREEENQALHINMALWTKNKDIPKDMEGAQQKQQVNKGPDSPISQVMVQCWNSISESQHPI